MTLPPPSILLGIPEFDQWYEGQSEAFVKAMEWLKDPQRFLGAAIPTGAGKSVLALLLAKLSGLRTVIITATKGLQEQYASTAHLLGGVVVKGQNNFRCVLVPTLRADEGPCHEGTACAFARDGGCPYRAQLQAALNAKIVITNYAYWLAQTNFSSGLGEFGLAIFDEGHMAFSAVDSFLTVYLPKMELESQGITFPSLPVAETIVRVKKGEEPSPPDLWALWKSWAACAAPVVADRVNDLDAEIRDLREGGGNVPSSLSHTYRTAKSIKAKLTALAEGQGEWVIQRSTHGYVFTPKWVAAYSNNVFHAIPKVMLMSAILSRKTVSYLGVPGDLANLSWLEVTSYFPPGNTPIYHVQTARINFRTDDYGTTIWHARIDQLISRRLDRKGIVFTVSYDRARLLMSRSRYKNIMITHSTGDVVQVVNKFKAMKPPAVLVSPSVTTGWDFPGNGKPQYIILGKIPIPDTRDSVTQARSIEDKDWIHFLAMETVVQSSGRASRSAGDQTEVFVCDDSWLWWYAKYSQFAPVWFRKRVRGSLSIVPDPLF